MNKGMDMKLETLVYDNYKSLNENDKYIWKYILNNKKECENMSIQDLAANCNVSHTTILRFAQKLGLNGYSELKFCLKLENNKKLSLLINTNSKENLYFTFNKNFIKNSS